ncbi:MAG: SDR family oxidoreductase [Flavobacteriales bacterium]|nr:SDR family oxidoreductase [Flavobacteriales bacterium]
MKRIVVIGASRGIGKELGLILGKDHKVLLLSRNLEALQEIQKSHDNLKVAQLDLADDQLKENLTSIVKSHFEEVDVLINNAGFLVNKPFLELNRKDITRSFQINVTGLIESCQAIVSLMTKGAHIVNIGSMGGFQGSAKFPGLSVYSSTKSAVAGFSECLAEELKENGISVNCLALGAAQTEMLEEAFPDYKAPVSANEMAEFITDFSLNAHQWINGKTIPVSLSTP